ncbi:MAG TPA: rRNA maturation RNase YbeY [Kiritimatiellia bacterium]|nr:rRNA maturation RNase YbeY [Kiritimatiellia bacterium]HRU70894.1 rRNA maturation RNase YbeY [Kiritimatiellia bacterium]
MRVVICQEQRLFAIDTRAMKRLACFFAERARAPAEPAWQEITIHLLDDAGIAPVNQAIMGHDGPTDVITQRYEPIPGEPDGLVGELFINVERAHQAAPRRAGWSPDRELALYLAHGCDHLSGADDATPRERSRMRRRELAWFRQVTLEGLFLPDGKALSRVPQR